MEYAETHPESALEMYEEINKLYKEYVEEEPDNRDDLEQDARLGLGPYADDYAQIDDD